MPWRVAAPLLLSTVLLTGCGADAKPAAAPPAVSAGPVAVTNCGTPVTITAPPMRVVTMNQAATEIMLALGLQDRMIGTAYLDDAILPAYADAYAKIPVLAKEYPTKEKLLEAEPDFVYASYNSAFGDEGVGDRADWQKLGVGSYVSPAGCPAQTRPAKLAIGDVFTEIRELAAIFGVSDRGEKLIADHEGRIATAAGTARNVKVLWWDGGSDAPSVGACCGAPNMIMSAAGVTNAFADLTGSWGDTSWETVTDRNPRSLCSSTRAGIRRAKEDLPRRAPHPQGPARGQTAVVRGDPVFVNHGRCPQRPRRRSPRPGHRRAAVRGPELTAVTTRPAPVRTHRPVRASAWPRSCWLWSPVWCCRWPSRSPSARPT
ncbi:ABC transporter substrate-binding protein [Micromonospora provocatoris]|nr:ABC transporter substrate-binding protein [Micromonospora provocatoris]RBI98780.1 ABC transporter substrate-binding protein [Micromonospora provocatoris]